MSVDNEQKGLAEPFKGITAAGSVQPGLFEIRSTGVSTEPVRKAAEALLAALTPEQRTKIYAARDRAFAAIEAHKQTRGAHMTEALALFEADTVDAGRLAAFRAQREAEHQQIADTVTQSLTEVHDVLTPEQRKAVADWIRAHHPGPRG